MNTLDDMLIETAKYCDVEISKTDGAYSGDSLVITDKLKSAINYAYKKICLEKIHREYKEEFTSMAALTKTFFKAISLKDADGHEIPFSIEAGEFVYDSDETLTLHYIYIPPELAALTDVPDLPANADLRIPCYYAAYFYLSDDSDERAAKYVDLWNDGFESLTEAPKQQKTVKNGWGW